MPPSCASARLSVLPLLVTVFVAMLHGRIPRGHALVITTSSRDTCRTSAQLVDGNSRECGVLRGQSSVLVCGLGKALEIDSGPICRLRVRICACQDHRRVREALYGAWLVFFTIRSCLESRLSLVFQRA